MQARRGRRQFSEGFFRARLRLTRDCAKRVNARESYAPQCEYERARTPGGSRVTIRTARLNLRAGLSAVIGLLLTFASLLPAGAQQW